MIDVKKTFFDQTEKGDNGWCDNIWKITNGQRDDFTTDYLLAYPYFKKLLET